MTPRTPRRSRRPRISVTSARCASTLACQRAKVGRVSTVTSRARSTSSPACSASRAYSSSGSIRAAPKAARSTANSCRLARSSRNGISRRRTRSHSAIRPPGRSTRAHSATSAARSGIRCEDSITHTRSNDASGRPLSVPSRCSKRAVPARVESLDPFEPSSPAALRPRRRGGDADGAGGDAENVDPVLLGEPAGRRARAAADVEHLLPGREPGGVDHRGGERTGGLGQRLVPAGEQAVVQLVAEQEAPGLGDPVVVRGGVVVLHGG